MSPVPLLLFALIEPAPSSDAELLQRLWESSPDLQPLRARLASARADVERAHLFPNPELELAAGTLPVGPQNPTAPVTNPALEVPNFTVGVSELIELGKRGPRQAAARSGFEVAVFEALDQLRQRFWDVRDQLGEIAAAQARIASLQDLAADAARLTGLQRARAGKGDVSVLDADRARIDEQRLSSTLGAERERLAALHAECARLAGFACAPFADAEAARAYLAAAAAEAGEPSLEERPDVKALEAAEAGQRHLEVLAGRRAIPDPTVRLGYVRDQYLASGNWQNSFFVGVSVPLPVFDRGQADARLARASAEAARRARERTLETSRRQLDRLTEQGGAIESRRKLVLDQALPLARDVVARLEAAVARGAAPVQDLLLARRSLVELQLDANDLELSAFHVRVARARFAARMPAPPEELIP